MIDFLKLESYIFNPHLFDFTLYHSGCGFNACALLTGLSPFAIKAKYKKLGIKHSNHDHMDESFIVPFLSKYYQIVKVEKENQLDEIYITNQITKRHILLVIQDYNKSEKSMSVIYNDIIYHNFSMMPLKPLEFLNRPLSSVFVLKKK